MSSNCSGIYSEETPHTTLHCLPMRGGHATQVHIFNGLVGGIFGALRACLFETNELRASSLTFTHRSILCSMTSKLHVMAIEIFRVVLGGNTMRGLISMLIGIRGYLGR